MVLAVSVVLVALIAGGSYVVGKIATSDVTFALPREDRPLERDPDLAEFCRYVTATSASEALAKAQRLRAEPGVAGERDVLLLFSTAVASSSPGEVFRDAEVVRRGVVASRHDHGLTATDNEAARQVDAYAERHCP